MISSTLFIFLIKFILFIKPISILLEKEDRIGLKKKLLSCLVKINSFSTNEFLNWSLVKIDFLFCSISDKKVLSFKYFSKLIFWAVVISLFVSIIGTAYISSNIKDIKSFFLSEVYIKFIILPNIISAMIFFPVDFCATHLMVRNLISENIKFKFLIILIYIIFSYLLWSISVGSISFIGISILSNYLYDFSFLLNRIDTVLFKSFFGGQNVGAENRVITSGFFALAVSVNSIFLAIIIFISLVLKWIRIEKNTFIANAIFLMIDILNLFKYKNIPVKICLYLIAFSIFCLLMIFKIFDL